jgi:Zn-dependent protease with chaperone function
MKPVPATYFDGRSARPQPVTLYLQGDRFVVAGEQVARTEPVAAATISEPLQAAPRVIRFADGAHCEVRDHAALDAMLHTSGIDDSLAVRLQARWHWALVAVALVSVVVLAGYYRGLPAAAGWIAERLPARLLASMGDSTLAVLDKHLFKASELPAARQRQLSAEFEQLRTPGGTRVAHRIEFRDGGRIGANAFALPNGTIIVTDQLVDIAGKDEEILGVLAHELGHLDRRHSLRMLIQGSMVGFLVGWYLGDVSNVAAGLPAALLQARYSRDFEREADDYAERMLSANGMAPAALAQLLDRMRIQADCDHGAGYDPFRGYLRSHPATDERILRLGGTPRAFKCPAPGTATTPGTAGAHDAHPQVIDQ